jgi:hypothetical protein
VAGSLRSIAALALLVSSLGGALAAEAHGIACSS